MIEGTVAVGLSHALVGADEGVEFGVDEGEELGVMLEGSLDPDLLSRENMDHLPSVMARGY
jgi:hypothetical protein